jgi:ATP-dependent Clp protease adaptor protein ClpS
MYRVIYINDNVTTMEFVVETLVIIFNYTQMDADEMTMKIHKEGSAIVATMPYEMAEQKGVEVTLLARNNGFPLVVKLEPVA